MLLFKTWSVHQKFVLSSSITQLKSIWCKLRSLNSPLKKSTTRKNKKKSNRVKPLWNLKWESTFKRRMKLPRRTSRCNCTTLENSKVKLNSMMHLKRTPTMKQCQMNSTLTQLTRENSNARSCLRSMSTDKTLAMTSWLMLQNSKFLTIISNLGPMLKKFLKTKLSFTLAVLKAVHQKTTLRVTQNGSLTINLPLWKIPNLVK